MKNKTIVLFLSALSFVFSSCSLLPSRTNTDGEVDPPHEETGLGYLKISLNSAGMFSTDYLFVGERGYQYFAKGKLDNGKDANYTYSATWTSSNPDVLYAGAEGRVKALKDGTAKLSASYNGYYDEIDVVIKTYASISAVTEVEDEYRTTRTYDMPLYVEPSNAFVEYSFSKENSIEVLEGNRFKPLSAGEVEVTAKVFVNEDGRSKEMKFTLNVIENDKPYFKYKDEEIQDSLTVDVAVNKYKTLDIADIGITAFAGNDDSDITDKITVKSGNYKLNELGEYPLVLSVVNNGVETTLPINLNIIEREEVTTELDVISQRIDEITYQIMPDQLSVSFTCKTHLPDDYEKYSGEIILYVQFEGKRKVSGYTVYMDKMFSRYIDHDSNKQFSYSFNVPAPDGITLRAGNENITITRDFMNFRGRGHNYITYPAED